VPDFRQIFCFTKTTRNKRLSRLIDDDFYVDHKGSTPIICVLLRDTQPIFWTTFPNTPV
jgi:hypothetical protein